MKTLRTPAERFVGLPDFAFAEHFVEVDDHEGSHLRVHYVDEGPRDADPIVLMHGEPTWSFLYRHMISRLVAAGHRVIAPDLVGFGKSDKPTEQRDYTYARHVSWMAQTLFDHLSIRRATIFGQDWGGLIGLRLVAAEPERFARVVMSNTGLPTGDRPLSDAFMAWQKFSQTTPRFEVGKIVRGGCAVRTTPDVVSAYDAPFPDDTYKAGARILPSLYWRSSNDPSCAASATATPSPRAAMPSFFAACPARLVNRMSPLPAGAISFKKTRVSNSPRSSMTSSGSRQRPRLLAAEATNEDHTARNGIANTQP
jgi:haloalkane dehalogenase